MIRRWIMFALLISLGINLGLGLRILNSDTSGVGPDGRHEHWDRGRGSSHGRGQEGRGQEHRGQDGWGPVGEHVRDMPDSTRWKRIGERRLERLAQYLKLTSEQKDFFRQGLLQTGPQLHSKREKVTAARHQVQEMITAGKVNPQEVRQAIHLLGRHESQLDSLMTEIIMGELEILEPEQRAQYLEILPVFRGLGQDRRMGPGAKGARQR